MHIHILSLFVSLLKTRRLSRFCRQQNNNYVWPSAVQLQTHQTLGQQGGTGEDSHVHLADWTLSVAAIEKKNQHFISTLLAQEILCHRLYSYNYFFSPFLCLSACSTKKVDTVKELSIIIIWCCEHAMHILCGSPLSSLLVNFTSFYWPLYQSVIGNSSGLTSDLRWATFGSRGAVVLVSPISLLDL